MCTQIHCLMKPITFGLQRHVAHSKNALHAAASYGHPELMEYLIENGAVVDLVDADGDTPLHVCESEFCTRILLQYGADPSKVNFENKTALQVAEEEERDEVLTILKDQQTHESASTSKPSM
eukprot:Sdes_comp9264_c0_seq1m744